jgi:tetratricopeptide (TPR) repeat protein
MDTALVTNLRFGKWSDVLAEPRPDAKWKFYTAMWLYAQGFAAANTRDFDRARKDRAELADMIDRKTLVADDLRGESHAQMAQIGLWLLDGEIARVNGHLDEAAADFRKAREVEQALPYGEPPTWYQPLSHILGAALLDDGKPAEAEAIYRDSLNTYRADGWALFGLAQALDAQGKTDEAARAREQFAQVWRLSDVKLASSRF